MAMKEHVTLEVRESVSPYGEMMKLLKEYIDQHDTITYCDALPDEGEEDHLYIVTSGEAYIWEDEWIELTGGGGTTGITGINVNGTPQEVINHVVDLLIPTKTSELEDDSGYITDEALEGYAKETDIPTKTSDLENDSGYITDSALDGYAKTEDIPTELSDLKNDMGYITEDALDGYALEDEIPTKVSQLENDADYTTVEATKAEIAEQIAEIVAGAPESLDTLKEIADWIEGHAKDAAEMNTAIKETQETATVAKETADYAQLLADKAAKEAADAYNVASTAQSTADSALTEAETVKDSIPTKVSELENDAGYITDSALEDYATFKELSETQAVAEHADDTALTALNTANALKDAAITGITLNGDEVPVTDNIAALTIEAEAPIEHIAVNGEEQPIEDKTVDLSIDRASVDGETLVVGDTAGGGNSQIVTGYDVSVDIPDTEAGFGFFCWSGNIAIASFRDGKVTWHASYNWIDCEIHSGVYHFETDDPMYYTIIMEG